MRRVKWLGIIPYIWLVVCVPFINSIHHLVLGMPPLLLWTMLGVIVTSLVLYIMYILEYKTWGEEGQSDG